jgi:phage-related protein
MAKDVIITPASGKLDFYATTGGSVLANINLTDNNDLSLSTTSGNLIIGDASRDVYIGNGVNNVDIVFEQDGEIRPLATKTLTIGASGAFTSILATQVEVNGSVNINGEITAVIDGGGVT